MRITAPGFRIGSSIEVDFSPDGALLATVGRGVALWSVAGRQRLRSVRMLRNPSDTSFSPDGTQLLIKSTRGDLHLCETATGDPLWHYRASGHDEGPGAFFVAPGILADPSWQGCITLRDVSTSRVTTVWHEEHTMIRSTTRAGTRTAFASIRKFGHPHFEDHASADAIILSDDLLGGVFVRLDRRWAGLSTIALSPTGDSIAVRHGRHSPQVDVIRISTGEVRASSPSRTGGTGAELAWAPDDRALVLVEKGGFSFRDADSLTEIGWLPSEFPSHVSFAPGGDLIALGDWSAGIVVPWPALLDALRPREASDLGTGSA